MKYPITNFAKGVVDAESQAKFDGDYRQKCSELKNFYIHQDQTLRKRPPLKIFTALPEGTLDFIRFGEKGALVFREAQIEDIRRLRSNILDHLFEIIADSRNPGYPDTFPVDFTYSAFIRAIEDPNNRTTDPKWAPVFDFFINQVTQKDIQNHPVGWVSHNRHFDFTLDIDRDIGSLILDSRMVIKLILLEEYGDFDLSNPIKTTLLFKYVTETNNISSANDAWQNGIDKGLVSGDATKGTGVVETYIKLRQEEADSSFDTTDYQLYNYEDRSVKTLLTLAESAMIKEFTSDQDTVRVGIFVNPYLDQVDGGSEIARVGLVEDYEPPVDTGVGFTATFGKLLYCPNPDIVWDSPYTFEPSVSSEDIRLTFAGMSYLYKKGGLINRHSANILLPTIDEVLAPDILPEQGKLHEVHDFPIHVVDINLAAGMPSYLLDSRNDIDIASTNPRYNPNLAFEGDDNPLNVNLFQINDQQPHDYFGVRSFDDPNKSEWVLKGENKIRLTNLSDIFREIPEMRQLQKYLKACLTEIIPHKFETPDIKDQGRRDDTVRYFLPDFKTVRSDRDSHEEKFEYQVPVPRVSGDPGVETADYWVERPIGVRGREDALQPIEETTKNIEISPFLFSYNSAGIEYSVFAVSTGQGFYGGEDYSSASEENSVAANVDSRGTPGVVIKIQVGNFHSSDGIPVYNPYGDLIHGTGSVVTGTDQNARFPLIHYVNHNLTNYPTRFIQNDDFATLPRTVRTLYLTYDYDSREVMEYFNEIDAFSSVYNVGDEVRSEHLVKFGQQGALPDNLRDTVKTYYLSSLVNKVMFTRVAPFYDYFIPDVLNGEIVSKPYALFNDRVRSRVEVGDMEVRVSYTLMPIVPPQFLYKLATPFKSTSIKTGYINHYTDDTDFKGTHNVSSPDGDFGYYTTYQRLLGVRFGFDGSREIVARPPNLREATLSIWSLFVEQLTDKNSLGYYTQAFDNVGGLSRDLYLVPYTVMPDNLGSILHAPSYSQVTFQRFFSEPTQDLIARDASFQDNEMSLSGIESRGFGNLRNRFVTSLANYISAFTNTASFTDQMFIDSGLEDEPRDLDDRRLPRFFRFFTKRGVKDNIITALVTSVADVFIGLSSSLKALVGGATNPTSASSISGTGTSALLDQESSFLIHAVKNNINQTLFYDEARGYVTNILNQEYRKIKDITGGENLYSGHRLFFFYSEGEKDIYVLTMGLNRDILGFSRFELPVEVTGIRALDSDKILVVSEQDIYTLDFSSDENTLYQDDGFGAWETRVTTLPISRVTDERSSLFEPVSINKVVISLSGAVDFVLEIIRRDGTVGAKRSVRLSTNKDLTKVTEISGPVLVESIPSNSGGIGEAPRVSIVSVNDKYLSIASMILDLGDKR